MIRILIADDHAIVRVGLREFLAGQTGIKVVAEAESGAQVLELIHTHECDLVLLDVSMPGQSGIDVLQRLKVIQPGLPVLILSAFPEKQYAVNLIRAGACGYLSKSSSSDELLKAIRVVAQGRKYVSAEFAQAMVHDLLNDHDDQPLHSALSEREFQIFVKLAGGVNVSRIAEDLHLSVKTISTYRTRVLEKMNMKSNADLTAYAIKNHLVE